MKLNKNKAVARIQEYFEENKDVFNACIEDLDAWNGCLEDDRYYDMDELDELYHDEQPSEILRRAFYGHDESYTTDEYGQKHYDAFNPNRDYFRFNGYGNLVSSDYKDYTDMLDKYVVEQMAENRNKISTINETDELANLFDALDDEEGD